MMGTVRQLGERDLERLPGLMGLTTESGCGGDSGFNQLDIASWSPLVSSLGIGAMDTPKYYRLD